MNSKRKKGILFLGCLVILALIATEIVSVALSNGGVKSISELISRIILENRSTVSSAYYVESDSTLFIVNRSTRGFTAEYFDTVYSIQDKYSIRGVVVKDVSCHVLSSVSKSGAGATTEFKRRWCNRYKCFPVDMISNACGPRVLEYDSVNVLWYGYAFFVSSFFKGQRKDGIPKHYVIYSTVKRDGKVISFELDSLQIANTF